VPYCCCAQAVLCFRTTGHGVTDTCAVQPSVLCCAVMCCPHQGCVTCCQKQLSLCVCGVGLGGVLLVLSFIRS
jgi:hypothetical protein